MTSQAEVFNYPILLPASTNPEVLEWFEFIHAHGNLSAEIINLVHNYIVNSQYDPPQGISSSAKCTNEIPAQDDLLNSLYNYDDAAIAIFCEEKKVKKKMLSV